MEEILPINGPDPLAELEPYSADILAHKGTIAQLPDATPLRQVQILQNMLVTTAQSDVTEKEYLAALSEGRYEDVRQMYRAANIPELERISTEKSDVITGEMRNAARNILGYINGTQKGLEKTRAETTLDNIGAVPEFQVPDWLFRLQEVAHKHPGTPLMELVQGLETTTARAPQRRIDLGE